MSDIINSLKLSRVKRLRQFFTAFSLLIVASESAADCDFSFGNPPIN